MNDLVLQKQRLNRKKNMIYSINMGHFCILGLSSGIAPFIVTKETVVLALILIPLVIYCLIWILFFSLPVNGYVLGLEKEIKKIDDSIQENQEIH